MISVIVEQDTHEVHPIPSNADGLWLAASEVERVTGFTMKPEGLCKEAICVPVPRGAQSFVKDDAVDVAAFWRHLGNPVIHDESRETWVLGIGVQARGQALETFEAPDFTLPDLGGQPHSMSQFKGKKVFLATWASW